MTNFKRNPATMPDGYIVLPTIPDPGVPTVAYARWGCYYNWHAINSGNGLAPDGYKIPSRGDFETLRSYIGDNYDPASIDKVYNVEFAAMYSAVLMANAWWGFYGEYYTGTNESGYNWLPAGRLNRNGNFRNQSFTCSSWTSSTTSGGSPIVFGPHGGTGLSPGFTIGIAGETIARYKRWGYNVRCLLESGETPPANGKAEDVEGNPYDVIQIGTQYWMAQNLRTTKFKNGNSIAQGVDAGDWETKSNNGAAFAYYNFNANYV